MFILLNSHISTYWQHSKLLFFSVIIFRYVAGFCYCLRGEFRERIVLGFSLLLRLSSSSGVFPLLIPNFVISTLSEVQEISVQTLKYYSSHCCFCYFRKEFAVLFFSRSETAEKK